MSQSCYSHSVCSTSNYCCITINPLFCSYDGCSSVLLKRGEKLNKTTNEKKKKHKNKDKSVTNKMKH